MSVMPPKFISTRGGAPPPWPRRLRRPPTTLERPGRRSRDWLAWLGVGTALIAALGALIFNGISAAATSRQIEQGIQGQLTDRYALGRRDTQHDSPKQEIDLSFSNFAGLNFRLTDLSGMNFTGSDLRGTILIQARLVNTTLAAADLSGARLSHANLTCASMFGANLRQADLPGANLVYADLFGATVVGANLDGADVTDANLGDTQLSSATGTPSPSKSEPPRPHNC
jgi:uncharacterized protein YjbI with pentapeptide repeats